MKQIIHCTKALLSDGWADNVSLTVNVDGSIERISASMAEPVSQSETAAFTRHMKGAVIPGMPNVHSHGFQRIMAGLAGQHSGNDSFWTWRTLMYELAQKLTPEQLHACQAGLFLEMLKSGYTSCAEFHYMHNAPNGDAYADPAELPARVMQAAAATGIGLTMLPVLYRRSGFGADGVEAQQRRFCLTIDAYQSIVERCRTLAGKYPNHRVGLAPHSLRAVNEQDLNGLLDLAGASEPIHIHIAEQQQEVKQSEAFYSCRPVEWLLDHADVNHRWCLVHATHINETEIAAAAASGAVAGLCPSTEADLGDGVFPGRVWMDHGGRWGIGSDSNVYLNAAGELRLLEYTQRLRDGARLVMAEPGRSIGTSLYLGAVTGGAQATGQAVGQLKVGKQADLVELDTDHYLLDGLSEDALLDTYLFGGDRTMISSVVVGGQTLIDRGRHKDDERLMADFASVLKELRR